MNRSLAALALFAAAATSQADGLQSLERFAREVKSGQAAFTQVVTAPAREGAAPRSKASSGQFSFSRPGRFRFDYLKPFAQTLVADGQTLWIHDPDLNQVTARSQAAALGQTPAALIASAADLNALRRTFALQALDDADGLQWVQATPLSAEAQVRRIRVGFRRGADAAQLPLLSVLEIDDSFGQRSVMRFEGFLPNGVVPVNRFEFTPPAGADVLGQ